MHHRGIIRLASLLAAMGTVLGCSGGDESEADETSLGGTSASTGGMSNTTDCPTGQTLCGTTCTTLASDPANCGECGRMCGTDQSCVGSVCTCPGGTTMCAGACIDIMQDVGNCEGCGVQCGPGEMCWNGQCQCQAGLSNCPDGCVNLASDGNNCGRCGNVCLAGQVCSAGNCTTTCAVAGETACGTSCVDLMTDSLNCGSCGTQCPAGQVCSAGACACPTGLTPCNGQCVDLMTDSLNCGSCATACAVGQSCYVRLRTFVDPRAYDGYDQSDGNCDLAHTIEFGRQVKEACMGLLIDFHYSDNWADPGKQCVPAPWQDYTTIGELEAALYDYTRDAIEQMIAGGARPDMVQIGNEITPGILIHLCDTEGLPYAGIAGYDDVNGALYFWSSTDQGAPPSGGPSPGGWTNLGILLNAAAGGVRDVDPGIKIALHLDRCDQLGTSESFIDGARGQGVPFDVFAESCYTGTQGQPSDWEATFNSLSSSYPDLELMIAEYSGEIRAANDVVYNLPNNQGIGTFSFTPNLSGSAADVYDEIAIDYAGRL